MPFCPQCGAPNPANAAFCGVCGTSIPRAAAAAPPPSVEHPPAPAQKEPAPRRALDLKQTMMGFSHSPLQPAAPTPPPPAAAPVAPAAPPAAPTPPVRSLHGTMVGMAQLLPPTTPAQPQGAPAVAPPTPPPATSPADVGRKTLVGVAIPGVAPTAKAPAARGKGQTMLVGIGDAKKTLIGVASPGLPLPAPTRRTLLGIPVPSLPPPEPEYVEEYYDEVVPETGEVERRVRMVAKPPPPLHKRPAFYVILGAVALLVGGVVVAVLVKSPAPLVAEVRQNAAQKDSLHVTCASCPDGATLTGPGGLRANVKGGAADLDLPALLTVGDNKIAIAIDRHGSGRDETVTLDVPVAYRIWSELAPLQDPVPSVRVMIQSLPGSTVAVQGKPVTLATDGSAAVKVDVSDALSGLAKDVKTLDREIAYTIAPRGGAPESGKLAVKVGIAPLTLESPGARMVTDQATFWLAGKTARGAGLSVAGKPISVSKEGTFEQMMNISRVGSTEVELRASAPSFAPRIATITVKRVDSLAQEAKDIDAQPRASFGDVLGKGDSAAGTPVGWKSEVVQASVVGRQTIAVVEVLTGCAKKPCRARVVASNAPVLATGDKVSVYGRVVGFTGAASELPDVEADFVLKGP